MCGIYGFITGERGRNAHSRLKFAEQAAIVDSVRGYDSSGVVLVPHALKKGQTADWCKIAAPGWELMASNVWTERMAKGMDPYHVLLGHNRAATKGSVNTDNAHPFQEGPITLIHNGTLVYTAGLPVSMHEVSKKDKKVEVDSHLICYNLAHSPVEDVVKGLDGAYVLCWHDSRDNSVYFIRNAQRPLHFMRCTDEDTILFASEPDMLWWLAGRNGFIRSDIYQLDTGVLARFDHGSTKPKLRRQSTFQVTSKGNWKGTGWGHGAVWDDDEGYPLPQEKAAARTTTAATTTKGGVGTTGKPPAPARVWIGGRSVPIPSYHRRFLSERAIPVDEILEFSVEAVIPQPGLDSVTVNGWVYWAPEGRSIEAMQCIIHGAPSKLFPKGAKGECQVQAIGGMYIETDGRRHPVVLARLVASSPESSDLSSALPRSSSNGSKSFPGPSGSKITVERWCELTQDGCIECGEDITLEQSDDILWVNGGQSPLCAPCVEKWHRKTAPEGTA
jgi:hypothetical protein